ncbi:TetR/AcrR family transcriptional regulator [Silvibacterium acidisoli]|uniref:TetR/AcrR family transcriptional regulator n=1 Tax=Acidobacteriaceae bacterium ZG23-2 TaxID=2883246 RepID=UPI00406CBAA2
MNEELRADARANRDRILDVARAAFSSDPNVSLNSIAKTAGIGAGTLYRHFPSRESLVLAIYRKDVDTLVALAPTLLSKHSPLKAFRLWCESLAQLGKMKYGVADILHAAASEQDRQETYQPMLGAVRSILSACEMAKEIRSGTDPEDVLVFLGLLWRIPPTKAGEIRIKRLLTILFRGLGADDKKL